MTGIVERLEAATEGSRELDYEIMDLDHGDWLRRHGYVRQRDGTFFSATPPVEGGERVAAPEDYTDSTDAALSLVERKLPGWSIRIYSHPGAAYVDLYRLGELYHLPNGRIERRIVGDQFEAQRLDDHIALAILEALFRALRKDEGDHG